LVRRRSSIRTAVKVSRYSSFMQASLQIGSCPWLQTTDAVATLPVRILRPRSMRSSRLPIIVEYSESCAAVSAQLLALCASTCGRHLLHR
jgi:hypothetical protein